MGMMVFPSDPARFALVVKISLVVVVFRAQGYCSTHSPPTCSWVFKVQTKIHNLLFFTDSPLHLFFKFKYAG